MDVYRTLGVSPIVNASGSLTTLGGSRTHDAVMEAMKEANKRYVFMSELQAAASNVISEATGAESGIVTAGCFSAMVAASAASMMRDTGLLKIVEAHGLANLPQESFEWIDTIQLLPRFEENKPDAEFYSQRAPMLQNRIKDEFIIQRTHRNHYDNAFTVAGGRLVWVGALTDWIDEDEYWHSRQPVSIRDLGTKITDKTAAIVFVQYHAERGGIQLEDTIQIAHKHSVPVIVDACNMLPPRRNLRTAIDAGADLVCFSGGKAIRGPNDTGILAGRSELVRLAHAFGPPYHGLCRGYKVGKEQIVGLIKALQIYVKQDDKTELDAWNRKVKYVADALKANPNVIEAKQITSQHPLIPMAQIVIDENRLGMTTRDVWTKLRKGDPPVVLRIQSDFAKPGSLIFNPFCLENGEEELVVSAIKRVLRK